MLFLVVLGTATVPATTGQRDCRVAGALVRRPQQVHCSPHHRLGIVGLCGLLVEGSRPDSLISGRANGSAASSVAWAASPTAQGSPTTGCGSTGIRWVSGDQPFATTCPDPVGASPMRHPGEHTAPPNHSAPPMSHSGGDTTLQPRCFPEQAVRMVVLGPEVLTVGSGSTFSLRVQLQQDSGDTAEGECQPLVPEHTPVSHQEGTCGPGCRASVPIEGALVEATNAIVSCVCMWACEYSPRRSMLGVHLCG